MCPVRYCAVLLVLTSSQLPAEERLVSQELATPVRLAAGGRAIDVAGFASPCIGDFDLDGKSDLLVGQLEHGRMQVYRNVGSDERPRYASPTWFQAGGRVASIPAGCAVGFTPQLVDYNGDGRSDVVTGSFYGGLLFAFLRKPDGTFEEAEVVENSFGDLQLVDRRYNSTIFVFDWNHDGNNDLLLGNQLRWVSNLGSNANPRYGGTLELVPGFPKIHGIPHVADWDGDGDADLIVANRNEVVWYRNAAKIGIPQLAFAEVLIDKSSLGQQDPNVMAANDATRQSVARPYSVCTTDFDGDGKLDLLLGDGYAARKEVIDREQIADIRNRRVEFAKNYRTLIGETSGKGSRNDRIKKMREGLRSWNELMSIKFDGPQAASSSLERHGTVWVYLRN